MYEKSSTVWTSGKGIGGVERVQKRFFFTVGGNFGESCSSKKVALLKF